MKLLGVRCYAIMIANTIQPGERFYGQWFGRHFIHTATLTATSTFATCTGTTGDGCRTTTGSTTTGTPTTSRPSSQLSSLLTPLRAGLSFGKLCRDLSVPPAKHFSYLLER